ncbi:MAG: hypothetical protein WCG28_04000 [bacterium]
MFFHHYHNFINHSNNSSSSAIFWGAFAGAFFAFAFGLITYVVTKRRERFVQHKNSLVKLERILNKHLNDIGVFHTVVMDMSNTFAHQKVASSRLFPIELPKDLDMEIGSVDLINKLLTYQVTLDRLNFNSSTLNHAITRVEDLFINSQSVPAQNFSFITQMLNGFLDSVPKINEMTKKFLVIVRIHLSKVNRRNSFTYGVFNPVWDHNISEEEIKSESEKLDQEITKIMKKDFDKDF